MLPWLRPMGLLVPPPPDEPCADFHPLTVPHEGTDDELKDAFVEAFREPCFHVTAPYIKGDVVCVSCLYAQRDFQAARCAHIIKMLDYGRVFVVALCWFLVAMGWFDTTQIVAIGTGTVMIVCLMNLRLQRYRLSAPSAKPQTVVCTGPTASFTGLRE